MCAGAMALARVRRLYFGAADAKGGAVLNGPRLFGQPTCHHAPEVYPGIGEAEAASLLRDFFKPAAPDEEAVVERRGKPLEKRPHMPCPPPSIPFPGWTSPSSSRWWR